MKNSPNSIPESDLISKKKSKLGVLLFIAYSLFYAGFVIIGVVNYEWMGKILFAGLNVAVIYGFGLIIFAIILGLIYNSICTHFEDNPAHHQA